jgi:clan AA aspartic protease
MIGHVDEQGRALIDLHVLDSDGNSIGSLSAWIDTGFNGDLVLPQLQIESLGLTQSSTVKAILADGSQVALKTYSCAIEWFGETRQLEVVANNGSYALLGVGLLLQRELHISYRTGEIVID